MNVNNEKTPWRTGKASIIAVVLLITGISQAQQPVYKPGEYPAPRYPQLPAEITLDDLMPVARGQVRRPDIGYRQSPGWDVKPGERILIVANDDYDPLVLEAVKKAIQEVGAEVDILLGNDKLPNTRDENWELDGSLEVDWFAFPGIAVNQPFGGITPKEQLALALAGNYDAVFSGTGGGRPNFPKDKLRWVYFPWEWSDKFLTNANNIPAELLKFIDTATWEQLKQAVTLRVTDPEGTDLTWTQTPADWQAIEDRYGPVMMGHLMPAMEGTKVNGTIAGTWNDTGPFPHMKITLQDGRLVKMEGGGEYARKWQAIIEKWKDVMWPGKPGPGLFNYFEEMAFPTNPQTVVPLKSADYARAYGWDRNRAGIVHFGIGSGGGEGLPQWVEKGGTTATQYYQAHPEVPRGHFHIHNSFLTLEITDKDGNTSKIIDKGRLTILDDPKVRREAAKYGDPDELLQEKWIPAIPGINVPGSYAQYSQDPGRYLKNYIETHWKNP